VRRFISELRVADVIRLEDVGSQLPQWLCHLIIRARLRSN
jgi:hypothetical protein